jgi:hypothetical protein
MKPTYALTVVSGLAVTGILLATQLGNSVAPTRGTTLSALHVSTVEIPAAAARLMADAQPAQQAERAKEVLNAVAAMSKPGLMPYVVSAMAKACPDAAPAIAAAATKALPEMATTVTKVAIEAAPAQTEPIVAAVCQQAPESSLRVASAAVQAMPSHSAAIFQTVATAVPQLRPYFVKAETDQNVATDATAILKQVYTSVAAAQNSEIKQANQQAVASLALNQQSATHPISLIPVNPITQVQQANQNAVYKVSSAQSQLQISAPSRGVGLQNGAFHGPTVNTPFVTPSLIQGLVANNSTVVLTNASHRTYSAP